MLIIVLVAAFLFATPLQAIIPFNMYNGSEPLVAYMPPDRDFLFEVGYEYVIDTHGYLAGHEDGILRDPCPKGNVLQLWQKEQDAIAALKGFTPDQLPAQFAQELFRDDDNRTHGIFTPSAKLELPFNMFFVGKVRIPYDTILAAYIPYRVVKLHNIRWCEKNPQQTFEQITTPPLIQLIEKLGHMDLTHDWLRHGFGDLVVRLERYTSYPQMRPWLRLANLVVRTGIRFPTGLKADDSKLLALPFGFGEGPGMLIGGRLELCYPHGMVLGIDGELMHLFGHLKCRRIRTNPQQTDLLFITQVQAYNNPGFVQFFNLFLEKLSENGGFYGRAAYFYTKQSDDTYYPCTNKYDLAVINSAESNLDWTAHTLAFTLGYDWCYRTDWPATPAISVFGKYGFNGKRAILANTVGFTISAAF